MVKIVSMSGSIGHPKRRPETTVIDEYVVKMSGKKHPRVLFIPTASQDNERYAEVFIDHYTKRLGTTVEVLALYRDRPAKKEIMRIIECADIIYVGGGNTMRMMKLWRKLGVDKLLLRAAKRGAVCCGQSAGAICWFREGNSDSLKYSNPDADYIRVKGLNLVDALMCPHYDSEPDRQPSLKNMMKTKVKGVAIALENGTGIAIDGDSCRIIAHGKKKARRIYWKQGAYHAEILKPGKEMKLKDLMQI